MTGEGEKKKEHNMDGEKKKRLTYFKLRVEIPNDIPEANLRKKT